MKKYLSVLLLGVILLMSSGCGKNIFSTFVDEEDQSSLSAKLDNASSASDYQEIIEDSESIINSGSASNEEKQTAYYVKAEATLGKSDLSTLDLFADIANAADDEDASALNMFDTQGNYEALLTASEAISSADSIASTENVTNDQNLIKGVVNTLIVVDRVKNVFDVSSTGNMTVKDEESNVWDSLVAMVKPQGEESSVNLSDFSQAAKDGFTDSDSLKDDQLTDIDDINDKIIESEQLYAAVKKGGTFDGVTYPGLEGDASPTEEELISIENQLDGIFEED